MSNQPTPAQQWAQALVNQLGNVPMSKQAHQQVEQAVYSFFDQLPIVQGNPQEKAEETED